MLLKDFIPPPDIKEFVQLYRIVHLQFERNQQVPYKAYPPRPEQCLAFYPYDTETIQYNNTGKQVASLPVVLYGQFTEVTNRIIGNHFLVFQVIFKPGALYRLIKLPATEITNQYLGAETFFSSQVQLVNEQLFYAKSYGGMMDVINRFVRTLIKNQRQSKLPVDDACNLLLSGSRQWTLSSIASEACLSNRQLERVFKDRTGVNPKLYARIIRFDKAFRLKNTYPDMDWLRIAMECDYHDYQHLSKEYKDFTGLTPTAFHEIENKAPERKLGLSEGYYS
ncbi:MAG: AraC family transcriptional regulator [Dinghuibacter sp.]|nr:AraC family transcriptional regulator [Dinghuibacter sp.]